MYQISLDNELIVDNFAGGGGASCGIEKALQRPVNIAINHDAEAIGMHEANHPLTKHYCESVWDVDPRAVTNGRPVGLAWFSPDCKHFSKAKGGKPVDKNIRGLAWVAVRWAGTVKPRVIILENVQEFVTWGPLREMRDENGAVILSDEGRPLMEPCPNRRGMTFNSFVNALRKHGYAVEWRRLKAHHYGAPTSRERLFLVARCDGRPIVWPEPTHGPGLEPYRTAAECIDWTQPCPSIFGRKKPLADKTMDRVAKGMKRYVFDSPDPFIVPDAGTAPFLTEHANGSTQRVFDVQEPLRTQCAQVKGGHFALVSPYFVGTGGPEYSGAPRAADRPFGTIMTRNHTCLVNAFIAKHFGGVVGTDIRNPFPTILTKGAQNQLVTSYISKMRGTNIGHGMDEPLHTITASGCHHAEVRAFLIKYFGTDQDPRLEEPLHTITTRDRFGLVMVRGELWQLVDIGMRMLNPRELYTAQGFPQHYIIDRTAAGKKLTRTAQVRMCGNSVPPDMAEALAGANYWPSLLYVPSVQSGRSVWH